MHEHFDLRTSLIILISESYLQALFSVKTLCLTTCLTGPWSSRRWMAEDVVVLCFQMRVLHPRVQDNNVQKSRGSPVDEMLGSAMTRGHKEMLTTRTVARLDVEHHFCDG